jgi:hypothetical protein
MTSEERATFIRDLIRSVEESILARVDSMPDDWDGHELRRYMADWFEDQNGILGRGVVRQNKATKRLADYRKAVLNRNL